MKLVHQRQRFNIRHNRHERSIISFSNYLEQVVRALRDVIHILNQYFRAYLDSRIYLLQHSFFK